MNEGTGRKIDELLKAERQRKEDEARGQEESRARVEGFHGKLTDVLEKVVEPCLQGFAERLTSGGRSAKMEPKEDQLLGPSATLFVAKAGLTVDVKSSDKITFQADGMGTKVVVHEQVLMLKGQSVPSQSFSLEQITAEKVEELTLAFVERALAARIG